MERQLSGHRLSECCSNEEAEEEERDQKVITAVGRTSTPVLENLHPQDEMVNIGNNGSSMMAPPTRRMNLGPVLTDVATRNITNINVSKKK